MIENFIYLYVQKIAQEPEKIRVEVVSQEDDFSEIFIYASSCDAGRLIGKDGKMIGAIKTLLSACKAKNGKSYKVIVQPIENDYRKF